MLRFSFLMILNQNNSYMLSFTSLAQSFWQRFEAENPDISLKRQGTVSINRALNCTREMAEVHLGNYNFTHFKTDSSATSQPCFKTLNLGQILREVGINKYFV